MMKLLITPKKSLGQNFLVNPRILDRIVQAAEITKEDAVLEVGPGTGNLTKKLAEKAGKVITIEKDRRLVDVLKSDFKDSNIEIIESDVLKLKIETLIENLKLKIENYKIVGNIPYYITSRFLRTIFTKWPKPKLVVLTIQKEVAQRIAAAPPHSSLLSVGVQFFARADILCYVTKSQFRPRPKVDSAVIKLTPKEKLPTAEIEKFFKIARAGFSQKRKLLISNLAGKLKINKRTIIGILKKLQLDPKSRAEELTIQDWIMISENL